MKEFEKKVKDRLTWDDNIDETQIEISINDGVAILKGCVSTYPEKVLAEIETQLVPGIKSVVNEIEVKFMGSNGIPSDQDIKDAMFCLLDANSELASNNVQIFIKKGKVILGGTVDSFWKKEKIQKMVSQIKGVLSVINEISINPKEKISDGDITKNLIKSMQDSVRIEAHKVDLNVEAGIVTLSGTLSSMSEYEAVKEIVRFTKGVIDIKDNLKWILQYNTT
jgi:osmotically-inducible protein OsmY